jgi:valyl-tRNA synthetase
LSAKSAPSQESRVSHPDLPKTYDPRRVEARWYRAWEERGYFRAEPRPGQPHFCITIPPPNVTGELHLGHALCYEIQDILGRYHRMLGKPTLILPGTDHAGIATQNVVERQLAAEGLSRADLGREKFLERVWQWKETYGRRIEQQFRTLGFAFDWSRDRFTMDPDYADAVLEAFVRLFDEGFIYRGERVINWCPRCRTAISDIEVEHRESPGYLYHIAYPYANRPGAVVVATTRPETMLGDTAVAVNPADDRYRDLVGEQVILPLVGREIPIIADHYADPEFGTGAVKVTPAHDLNDFEAGERHNLPRVKVIGDDGRMTAEAGRFAGLDRFEAREAVVEALRAEGRLVEVEPYPVSLGTCERCGTVLEPLLSEQWFVRMRELAQPGIEAVESGRVGFIPERWADVYLEWMRNIRDWCISRQLWWGHRIPVYTCQCGKVIAAKVAPERCPDCGGPMTQDPDVLDTWFSSALWPFATLGWPRRTADLEYFYPTDLMVTSSQIIFLWVARMVMTGLHFLGDIPFPEVLINATVLNAEGRRMSKSLGTGVDPEETVLKYGADATRFGLIAQSSGQQVRLDMERMENGRNFCNKIWNAARFVLTNLGGRDTPVPPQHRQGPSAPVPLDGPSLEALAREGSVPDRWIASRLSATARDVTAALENYRLDEAARLIYDFFWGEFCDWYLEMSKPALRSGGEAADRARRMLVTVLANSLKLLHPIMPFITEEIWQALPVEGESIMIAPWPSDLSYRDPEAEEMLDLPVQVTRVARDLKVSHDIAPSHKINLFVFTPERDARAILDETQQAIQLMSGAGLVKLLDLPMGPTPDTFVSDIFWRGRPVSVCISAPLSEEDRGALIGREQRRLARLEAELQRLAAKLSNPNFAEKAPAAVIEKTRAQGAELTRQVEALRGRLASLERTSS